MKNESGIKYDTFQDENLVNAIMSEEVGNLEWIVAHFVWDMDCNTKNTYLKLLEQRQNKK
jgi:hypothetical protein